MDYLDQNISLEMRSVNNESLNAYPEMEDAGMPCCLTPPSELLMLLIERLEYLFPCLLAVGLPMNVLYVMVFMRTRLRKLTTVHYFIACGITDSLYLCVTLFPWLRFYDIWISGIEGICQTVYYLRHLTNFLSSWYMAFALLDMWIYMYTLSQTSTPKRYCSVFKTRALILSVFVLALVALLYLTWTTGPIMVSPDKYWCEVIMKNKKSVLVLSIMRISFSSLLPATVCFVLVFMLFSTCCSCRERWTVDSNRDCIFIPLQSQRTPQPKNSEGIKIKQQCLTAVCLVIGISFILMSVPLSVVKLGLLIMNQPPVLFRLLDKLFSQLYNINFAWKFLIYYVLLPAFRGRLWKCCFSRRSKKSRSNGDTFITGEVV